MNPVRCFLTGVGGQGTLTATRLLGQIALDNDIPVLAGEIHGMAQRGGVVESTLLFGGLSSPRISHGEADVLLGFEPLETLRALCYLRPGGSVISNAEFIPPLSVATAQATQPGIEEIRSAAGDRAGACCFLPCLSLGRQAGVVQSANFVLLAAACASGALPLNVDQLRRGIERHLRPKLVPVNLKAVDLGVAALGENGCTMTPR